MTPILPDLSANWTKMDNTTIMAKMSITSDSKQLINQLMLQLDYLLMKVAIHQSSVIPETINKITTAKT